MQSPSTNCNILDYQENNLNSIIQFSKIFGDTIAVGFSGGPDSLKTILIAKQYFKRVIAIIENDVYSPTEFLFKILSDLKISFVLFKPTDLLLTHTKDRNYRLSKFSEICINLNIKIIWLGHNLEDLIGTFNMRLERQSSWWGLSSIAPITLLNTIYICRPLLYLSRSYIVNNLGDFPVYNCPENNIFDDKHRRNMIADKIDYNYFFSIYKMGQDRANLMDFVEDFCSINFKLLHGYGELSYKIFDLNDFLMEKVLHLCSNYIYPNMISDYISRFKLKKNFNLGGIFFQFNKRFIYLFRERKEQKFGQTGFIFDKRWITNYDIIEPSKREDIPIRASLTIPSNSNKEYKYVLPSFISYFNIKLLFNKLNKTQFKE